MAISFPSVVIDTPLRYISDAGRQPLLRGRPPDGPRDNCQFFFLPGIPLSTIALGIVKAGYCAEDGAGFVCAGGGHPGAKICQAVMGRRQPQRHAKAMANMNEHPQIDSGQAARTEVRTASKRHEIRENRKAIVAGTLIGWLMKIGCLTLRFHIEDRCGIGQPGVHPAPVIYALWHNRFFTVPAAWRKLCGQTRKSVVLTSASNDGAMVARAMAVFGFRAVRGSSSRRAVAALVGMKQAIRDGFDVCVTPDGPRGPRYVFHPGLVKIAETTHTPIIPIHVRFDAAWRLKTWDHFVIPKPFSRVHVIFDRPLTVLPAADAAAFEMERQRIETILLAGVDDSEI